jgi:hypothetical protein
MNIFEQASRQKARFASIKGEITTEQLWDLPLQSKSGFDLDTVAKNVNAELKGVTEESFVATTSNPAKATLELKLEIVKHVIAVRLAENEAQRSAAAKAAEKQRLLDILAKKEDQALEGLTPEQIRERINQLG